jgi:hypothetical protein
VKTKEVVLQLLAECSEVRKRPCGEQMGKALSEAGYACVVANPFFHSSILPSPHTPQQKWR